MNIQLKKAIPQKDPSAAQFLQGGRQLDTFQALVEIVAKSQALP